MVIYDALYMMIHDVLYMMMYDVLYTSMTISCSRHKMYLFHVWYTEHEVVHRTCKLVLALKLTHRTYVNQLSGVSSHDDCDVEGWSLYSDGL